MDTLLATSKPTYVVPDWEPLRPTWTSIIRPAMGMTSEDFQATGTSALIMNPRHYLCDDMGCIDGGATVTVNRHGASRRMPLWKLWMRWHRGKSPGTLGVYADGNSKIRCYDEETGQLGLATLLNVQYSGEKPTIIVRTRIKAIQCTPDHLFLTPDGWQEAQTLLGKKVMFTAKEHMMEHNCTTRLPGFIPTLETVLSIEPAGVTKVYDVTVEKTHTFVADGFIVHNCGKTKQFVDAARYVWRNEWKSDARRILGVVKAGGLDQWNEQFRDDFPEAQIFLLRGTPAEREQVMRQFLLTPLGCSVLLVGYEIFRQHNDWMGGYGLWDWVFLDEAHKACSSPLNGGQARVAQLIHNVTAPRMTAISGTPIPDTPEDAWNVNVWLGFEFRSWEVFKAETLITIQYSPMRNRPGFRLEKVVNYVPEGLAKLHALLNSGIMTRRTKDDELDLPGKTYTHREVQLNPEEVRRYRKAERLLLEGVEGDNTIISPLSKLDRLIQISSSLECIDKQPYTSSKIKACLDILTEAGNQKVIFYSRFIPVLRGLYRVTKAYNPAYITGASETTVKPGHAVSERREMEMKFQTDDTCRVFIGSTKACMEQLTLTAGTIVVFLDKLWAPKQNEQAEDRANRIGTTKGITIITLNAHIGKKTTVDAYRNKRLAMKSNITDAVLSDVPMTRAEFTEVLRG